MNTLSVIIVAKNESKNIERCLSSLQMVADEIILIIDDSTTDDTYEKASKFPKVIIEVIQWQGFAKTKQYAVDIAQNDWIFWIDADEAVRQELEKELLVFKESEPGFVVYSVSRRAYFLNKWIKHSGWYPARVNRLFNKKFVRFSENEVHEHLVFDGKQGHLENDLDHFTDPDLFHYFEKFNKYTTLAARDLKTKNYKLKKIDLLIRPIFVFIKMYIIKLGFLDGVRGLILALFSSAYVLTKYSKYWEQRLKE